MKILTSIIAFLLLTAGVRAQCCNGVCPTGQRPSPVPRWSQSTYKWYELAGTGQHALFLGDAQVGSVDPIQGYRSYNPQTKVWGEPSTPPVQAPIAAKPASDSLAPRPSPVAPSAGALPGFATEGVNMGRLAPPGESPFWVGENLERPSLEGPSSSAVDIPDRSKQRYITIVCKDPAEQRQLAGDVDKHPLRTLCQICVVGPENSRLKEHQLDRDESFQRRGHVALVQDPPGADGRGQVVRCIYTWSSLDELVAQLDPLIGRKADPNYDPNAHAERSLDLDGNTPLYALGLLGLVGLVIFVPQKEDA